MEKYIIDRFEEEYAVLEREDGKILNILKSSLPDAKKGDVIVFENGIYTVDKEETERRKKIIAEKVRKLFEMK